MHTFGLCLALVFLWTCSGGSVRSRQDVDQESPSPTLEDYLHGKHDVVLNRCQNLIEKGSGSDEVKVCVTVLPAIALLMGNQESASGFLRLGCEAANDRAGYVAMVARLYLYRANIQFGEKKAKEGLAFLVLSAIDACKVSAEQVLDAVKRHSEMLK